MKSPSLRLRPWLLATPVLALMAFVQDASAARLLRVDVTRDGAPIVSGYYEDAGDADAATVWRYLQRPLRGAEFNAAAVTIDPASPLAARLEGDLVVTIQHADRVIAQARVRSLSLLRMNEQTQAWFLPEAEVERTAAVAGLGPPTKPLYDNAFLLTTTAGVALSAACVIALLLAGYQALRLRTKGRVPSGHDGIDAA